MAVNDDLPLGSQRMYPTTRDSRVFDAGPQETSINIAIADDYPVLLAGMRQSLGPVTTSLWWPSALGLTTCSRRWR